MLIYNQYPLTTIMIILLALLDDIPIMTIAWDNAELSPKPVRWQMDRLLAISIVLGALALAQSFALYLLARDYFNIGIAETRTMMFLRFILGGHLLLFVTRTHHPLFRPPYPSWQLLTAIVATQIVGVLFVGFGWLMPAISWTAIGLIWAYDIVWMVVMDVFKLGYLPTDRAPRAASPPLPDHVAHALAPGKQPSPRGLTQTRRPRPNASLFEGTA